MIRGMCISSNESTLGAFGNYLINSVVVFLSLLFSKQTYVGTLGVILMSLLLLFYFVNNDTRVLARRPLSFLPPANHPPPTQPILGKFLLMAGHFSPHFQMLRHLRASASNSSPTHSQMIWNQTLIIWKATTRTLSFVSLFCQEYHLRVLWASRLLCCLQWYVVGRGLGVVLIKAWLELRLDAKKALILGLKLGSGLKGLGSIQFWKFRLGLTYREVLSRISLVWDLWA